MKAKKILTAGMSVALALTIASVTDKAWPNSSYHIAKADFGDTVATDETKHKLNELIDKILNDKDITNRYLGTSFFHKKSNFPYYHISFEDHSVPTDVIDSTPWYNMWSEAYAIKTKLDANSFTEKTAKHAIEQLSYYNQLYNFETSHVLSKDGFYSTTNFKTPAMIKSGGDGEQDFYIKAQNDNTESIKELFKEGLLGIYKQGQEIEINLVSNPDKVAKITGFFVNKVSTYEPNVELGPDSTKQNIVAFKVPGELKADQLVITNMKYIDNNGNEQQTGTFALDIDYSKLKNETKDGDNGIPKYRENLNSKIDKWLDRARKVNEWLLSTDDPNFKERRDKIDKTITDLENLKRDNEASYDKLYKLATPIHEEEDIATLQEVIDMQVEKVLDSLSIYTETTYDANSIKAYKEYVQSVPKLKNGKNIKELVGLLSELNNANFKYLKFNTTTLEKLIDIANTRKQSDYSTYTWEKFSIALNHAKDWIDQNKKYRPQIDDTSSLTTTLLTSINSLVKNDGKPGEQVVLPKEEKKIEKSENYNISGKFVERGDTKELDIYGTTLSQLIKNIEVVDKGNGKNELIITFGTIQESSGAIAQAILELSYNKSGVYDKIYDVETAKGRVNGNDITYVTKAKMLVDADKKDINVDFVVADSWSFNGGKTQKYGDLLLDYSSKVETNVEKKDPLKEQLKEKLSQNVDNYKNLDNKFKVQLEQLRTQANNLITKDTITKEEVTTLLAKFSDEESKLSYLENLNAALSAQKEMYENFWKDNTNFTKESIQNVKSKLDELEKKVNSLDVIDIEGEKETITDEFDKEREVLVYKTIDSLTNSLQGLADYLRVDTTNLEKEVEAAKAKLVEDKKDTVAYKTLEAIINEALTYIKNSKLTPDEVGTDDQVNTNLTDYYAEQLRFAIYDLDQQKAPNASDENNKPDPAVTPNEDNNTEKPSLDPKGGENETPNPNNEGEFVAPDDSPDKPNKPDVEGVIPSVQPEDNNVEGGKVENSTNISAAFNKVGEDSQSMMNAVLKGAKYITENGKNYIELELQPLVNSNNVASGVLNKLTVVDSENKEQDTIVVEEKEITLTFNGVTETYKYPTKIRIEVTGKPTSIKVNTFANSPVFGTEKHENYAILSITYPNEVTNVDTKDLQTLYTTATSKYYDSWSRVFKQSNIAKYVSIIDNFGKKVNIAQEALKQRTSSEKVNAAYKDLLNARIQFDFLIRLNEEKIQLMNNFNFDKDSNKFTKESIATIDTYLQQRVDKLEELLLNNPSSSEVNTLFDEINSYNTLLRYDTSDLEKLIKDAEVALTNENLADATKEKINTILTDAKTFVEKAKTTYSIQDIRKQLAESLNATLKDLENNSSPSEPVPSPKDEDNTLNPSVTPGDENVTPPAPGNEGDNNTPNPNDENSNVEPTPKVEWTVPNDAPKEEALSEYPIDNVPAVSDKGEANIQPALPEYPADKVPAVSDKGEANIQPALPEYPIDNVPAVSDKGEANIQPALPEYPVDNVPAVSDKGEANVQPALPEYPADKVPAISDKGEANIQPALPEYPADKVPAISDNGETNIQPALPEYPIDNVPAVSDKGDANVQPALPEYPVDKVPAPSVNGETNVQPILPEYPVDKVPAPSVNGETNVQPVLPEYPVDKVPAISEEGEANVQPVLPEYPVDKVPAPSEKGEANVQPALPESGISLSNNNTLESSTANKNQKVLTTTDNTVIVELENPYLATNISAEKIMDANLVENIKKQLNLTPNDKVRILDLKLLDKEGKEVISNANRKVTIKLDEDEQNVKVYHINTDGALTFITSTLTNNTLSFEIDHFSKFAIISSKSNEQPMSKAESTNSVNQYLSDEVNLQSNNELLITQNSQTLNANIDTPKTDAKTIMKENKLSKTSAESKNILTYVLASLTLLLSAIIIRRKTN